MTIMKSASITTEQDLLITPAQLAKWLQNKNNVYILDVRPESERKDWSIPESRHLDIYNELKSGHSKTLEHFDLPEDRPIVTVCGAGKTSLSAGRQLLEKGLEPYSLDGRHESLELRPGQRRVDPTRGSDDHTGTACRQRMPFLYHRFW